MYDPWQPAVVLDGAGAVVEVSARGELSAPPVQVVLGASAAGTTAPGAESEAADVAGWAGPWPTEERWWDEQRARRCARLQLVCGDGRALLVTRSDGAWWLEAVYD
ncbi:MAG: hypothetical protein JJU45_17870 [Acidimicrobiia bacterium]|nr:hypothetical protein [Acidimicrobiia bacterium]